MSKLPEPARAEAYVAPRLTVYGAVTDLTASGRGTSCEAGNYNPRQDKCEGSKSTGGVQSAKRP